MIPDFPHNIKPYLFARPNPITAIISWQIIPTNDPTNNRTNWIWTSKKIGLYIMRKVWYHQTLIQNYSGFIVSDLTYILFLKDLSFDMVLNRQKKSD